MDLDDMDELKCKTCGTIIDIEEGQIKGRCQSCGTPFSLEEEYIKAYKETKEKFKAEQEDYKEAAKMAMPVLKMMGMQYITGMIIGVVVFFVVSALLFGTVSKMVSNFKSPNNDLNTPGESGGYSGGTSENIPTIDGPNGNISDEKAEALAVSSSLESMYKGSEFGVTVKSVFETVIEHNKNCPKYQMAISLNGQTTKNPDEITQMKNKIDDWSQYDISYEFSKEKIITKVIITNK